MNAAQAVHELPYLASVAISASVAVHCWRSRGHRGARPFAVVALAQAASTLGFVLEEVAAGLDAKLFWDNVQFLTIAPLPVAMLAFALEYTGRTPARPGLWAALALPSVALAALAFGDPRHPLVRSAVRLVPGDPYPRLLYDFTPAMTAWCLYVLALAVATLALLTAGWIRSHPLYRAQANLVLLGFLLPVAGGVLTLTMLRDSPARDITPLTFAAGNLLVAWGISRRRLFDVVPVARHMVIESLGDAVYVLDSDQRLVDLNRAARAQLGAGGRDPVGRPAAEVLPIPLHRLPADGGRVEVEDGASPPGRYLELRVHALTGAAGEPVGRVVVVCDVTGRRRTEEALRAARDELEERVRERTAALEDAVASLRLEVSQRTQAEAQLREEEARFRTVVENLSEAVLLTDLDGIVTFASERIEEVTGYPPAELVGRRAGHVLLAEDELRAADERLEDRRAGRSGRWEVPITRKDGSTGRVEVIGTAIRDAEGRTVGGLDAVTDVTERHRAEAELHAVRERFRLLVETVRDYAIVAVDPDGYVVSWNAGAERIAGYTAEQILGRHVSVFYPPEEAAQGEPQRMLETALREGSAEVEGWRVRADGSRHWTNTVLTPLRDGSGTLVGYAAITRDLTDRRAAELALRRSEEQLRHSQKMEAVGRLAGGIAHDFNNVLMAVGGHVQLLLRRTGEDDPRRASLLEIRKGVDRAAALVRQLLAFSRTQAMEPRVLDLREVVSGMDGMLRGVLGDGVRLELRLDPATPAVRADAGQLEQVIMNLVVNARDAMPGGGTIRVRTAAAPAGGEEGGTDSGLPPGRYALLAVADDGYGIDAAALPHVFEPFFTTKEEGKGTGLGLSTVYGIVTQSGGAVTVESTPGVETTFRVFLPAVQEEVEDGPPARLSAAGRVPRGGETVLLAEDDDGARAAAREALRLSGYRVLEARSGAEALELAESHGAAIHLLLAGGALPGPAGPELARRVRALHPEARVLHLPAPAGAGAAGRPAPAEALARRVREALDRPAEVVR